MSGALGGFAQGLVGGFQQGQALNLALQKNKIAQAQIAAQKRQEDVSFAQKSNAILSNYVKTRNKPLFTATYTALQRAQFGEDHVKSAGFKDNLKMLQSLDDEGLQGLVDLGQKLTSEELEPGQLTAIARVLSSDVSKGLALVAQVNKAGTTAERKQILGGAAQPSSKVSGAPPQAGTSPVPPAGPGGAPEAPSGAQSMIALRGQQLQQLVTAGDKDGAEALRKQIKFLREGIPVAPKDMTPESLFAASAAAATIGQTDVSARFLALGKEKMPSESIATIAFPGEAGRQPEAFRKDDPALDQALQNGGVPVQVRLEQLGGLTTKAKATLRKEKAANASDVAQLSSVLNDLKRIGSGVTGVRGFLGDTLGGLAGIIKDEFGEAVTRGITGVDQAELQDFRIKAQSIMANEIETITGEQSGRISEPERQLTTAVTKGRSATASLQQVVGAFKALVKLKILTGQRISVEGGEAPDIIIKSNADYNRAFAKYKRLFPSFSDEEVGSIVNDLEEQQLFFSAEGLI